MPRCRPQASETVRIAGNGHAPIQRFPGLRSHRSSRPTPAEIGREPPDGELLAEIGTERAQHFLPRHCCPAHCEMHVGQIPVRREADAIEQAAPSPPCPT